MEKSVEQKVQWQFEEYMSQVFHMGEVDIREYSPLTLAYIGDSIYDLVIKTLVISRGNRPVNQLHRMLSLIRTGLESLEYGELAEGGFEMAGHEDKEEER